MYCDTKNLKCGEILQEKECAQNAILVLGVFILNRKINDFKYLALTM